MDKENKITYIKGTYIWSFDKNFQTKIKMIKSVNGNIKLQNMSIYKDGEEYILKPRCIINDPFDEDNSILLSCDIIDLQNKCCNYDARMTFLKQIQHFGKNIKENNSKISFSQSFSIKDSEIDKHEIINKLIKRCLSCNIELDEIEIKENIIIVSNKFTNVLSSCDELYFVRFIFEQISLRQKFSYEIVNNLYYKFSDDLTFGENGLDYINKYIKKLEAKHSLINKEELVEKFKGDFEIGNIPNDKSIFVPKSTSISNNGYFGDNRFSPNSDPYKVIFSNINEIYS